jgi:catechol 2,3-dioxygenase-like lactoylglutathione lyase family enzyme
MSLKMKLGAITLDCPDPRALAAFYQQATGLRLHPASHDDFVSLTCEDGLLIGFQRVDGYQAPSWPGQNMPQQLHLCFAVDDLDKAEALILGLGAAKPEFQPNGDRGRVFTDPAGHPFCLTRNPPA